LTDERLSNAGIQFERPANRKATRNAGLVPALSFVAADSRRAPASRIMRA
jgi:hypothetical protein